MNKIIVNHIEKEGTGIEKEGTGIEKEGTGIGLLKPLALALSLSLAGMAQAEEPLKAANLVLSQDEQQIILSWHLQDRQGLQHLIVGQKSAFSAADMPLYEVKLTEGYPTLMPVGLLKVASGCGVKTAQLHLNQPSQWNIQWSIDQNGLKSPEREGSGTPEREGSGTPEREGSGTPEREGSGTPEREGSGTPEREGSGTPEREGSGTPEREGSGTPDWEGTGSPEWEGTGSPEWEGSGSPDWEGTGLQISSDMEILVQLSCGRVKEEPLGD